MHTIVCQASSIWSMPFHIFLKIFYVLILKAHITWTIVGSEKVPKISWHTWQILSVHSICCQKVTNPLDKWISCHLVVKVALSVMQSLIIITVTALAVTDLEKNYREWSLFFACKNLQIVANKLYRSGCALHIWKYQILLFKVLKGRQGSIFFFKSSHEWYCSRISASGYIA